MGTAVNPSTSAGISIGSAIGSISEWLRQITVRVSASRYGHGSGVVWHSDGLIVTNAHVATGDEHRVELADGRTLPARLIGRDAKRDLAALAVEARGLAAATIRSARELRAGEVVIAVGNPYDGHGAVSTGLLHQPVEKSRFVVADIRLAPGNSGGPLADAQGNVIGINSMVIAGFGCAVTSDEVERFLQKLGVARKL